MKFLRFIKDHKIKSGYYDGKKVIELKDPIEKVLDSWENWKYLRNQLRTSHSVEDINFLPPVKTSKIICVGLNYTDHCKELDMDIPEEPKLFLKPPSSVIGHTDLIKYPKLSNEVDYEGELAIIIGKEGKNIEYGEIQEFISGYTILNDVTARDLQRKDEQWTRSKSFDTFCPIGPFIDTELDEKNQKITTKLNGEIKQESNTRNMIFSPHILVEYISSIMTLKPGDIIATGTPSGVGQMQKGDTVEIAIEDLGVLKNQIV
ncbi:fumarylacetoacetate hydrolase family protein [Methanobrevibacter filiformis]|uniref:Ureidoglycolate lyase n=1 Tax=Methanobrevibacter filiformis TaxID=55758 RepID=A0A166C7U4_9EURY|nr:fumarylacetoacetate hydrolase family protein [Methanobrevibacter filiformis]KZX14220.1 ureidoglycolate lyase [Methanobrevibacter filiformis]